MIEISTGEAQLIIEVMKQCSAKKLYRDPEFIELLTKLEESAGKDEEETE